MRINDFLFVLVFSGILAMPACYPLEEKIGIHATLYNSKVFPYPTIRFSSMEWNCGDTIQIEFFEEQMGAQFDFLSCDLVYPEDFHRISSPDDEDKKIRLILPKTFYSEDDLIYIGVRQFFPPLDKGGKVVGYRMVPFRQVAPCNFRYSNDPIWSELRVWDPLKRKWENIHWDKPRWE